MGLEPGPTYLASLPLPPLSSPAAELWRSCWSGDAPWWTWSRWRPAASRCRSWTCCWSRGGQGRGRSLRRTSLSTETFKKMFNFSGYWNLTRFWVPLTSPNHLDCQESPIWVHFLEMKLYQTTRLSYNCSALVYSATSCPPPAPPGFKYEAIEPTSKAVNVSSMQIFLHCWIRNLKHKEG